MERKTSGIRLAGIVLVGAMLAGCASEKAAEFAGWRPLAPNEVCPQGHVETFTLDVQGRRVFARPQSNGQDIPCGLARPY